MSYFFGSLRPWKISLFFHLSLTAFFLSLTLIPKSFKPYEVQIEISMPTEVQNLDEIKEQPNVVLKSVNETEAEVLKSRQVFGTSRDSYTDERADGVEAKKGNTLAKEKDDVVLQDSDSTSLPTPTEDYLVSEMPLVISEIRPVYPKEAKDNRLEGSVALDVLIDELGNVRLVSVIEGADIFRAGAIEAMRKFKFKPARVDGKSVAVRIRYTLNFKLEF